MLELLLIPTVVELIQDSPPEPQEQVVPYTQSELVTEIEEVTKPIRIEAEQEQAQREQEQREEAERQAEQARAEEARQAAAREEAARAEPGNEDAESGGPEGGQDGTDYAKWEPIARCESGYGGAPQWDINTGNGYYGGLQFNLNSWQWVGGEGYPHHASKEEQIKRAEILLERQGWVAWPACSAKVGYR